MTADMLTPIARARQASGKVSRMANIVRSESYLSSIESLTRQHQAVSSRVRVERHERAWPLVTSTLAAVKPVTAPRAARLTLWGL